MFYSMIYDKKPSIITICQVLICLLLIAEQNAHKICLKQEYLQILRRLLWSQTITHSLRNIHPMFEGGNLCVNFLLVPVIQSQHRLASNKESKSKKGVPDTKIDFSPNNYNLT